MGVIEREFFPILILGFLVAFLVRNDRLDRVSKRLFYEIATVEFLEILFYELGLWTATWSYSSNWRVLFGVICYELRPLILCLFVMLFAKDYLTEKRVKLLMLPILISSVIMLTALFSPITFSFNEANEFVRGPLGYVPLYTVLFYFVLLVYYNYKYEVFRRGREQWILAIALVGTLTMVLFDTLIGLTGRVREMYTLCTLVIFVIWQNRELDHLITVDTLTGLLTRATTMKRMEHILQTEDNEGTHALLMVDMDNLKQVNDRLGHQFGDRALKDFADEIVQFFNGSDVVGRIGGDEFFVFIRDVNPYFLENQLQRLLEVLEFSYESNGIQVTTTASIGISLYNGKATRKKSLKELYGEADAALYESKARGKHTYTFSGEI